MFWTNVDQVKVIATTKKSCQILNYDKKNYDQAFEINHYPSWSYIPDCPYRTLVIGGALDQAQLMCYWHCLKSVRIRSYSGPHFSHILLHLDRIWRDTPYLSVFNPNGGKCGKNPDQNNSEYRHFLRSVNLIKHRWHNIDKIYLQRSIKICWQKSIQIKV